MKVIVVRKDCVINGTFHRKGEVVQIDDKYQDEEIIKEIIRDESNGPTEQIPVSN